MIHQKPIELVLQGWFVQMPALGGTGKSELPGSGRRDLDTRGRLGLCLVIEELGHRKYGEECGRSGKRSPGKGPEPRGPPFACRSRCQGNGLIGDTGADK